MTTELQPSKEDAAPQQIAREAANEIRVWDTKAQRDKCAKIILSDIDRATEANRESESSEPGAPFPSLPSAQPQPRKARKEQAPRAQVSPASGERSELRDNEGRSLKDIQEWEQAGHDIDDPTMIVSPRGASHWQLKAMEATKQLLAERQRREQAERLGEERLHQLACYLEGNPYSDPDFIADSPALKAAVKLREQLLSAQAVIEKAGKWIRWHAHRDIPSDGSTPRLNDALDALNDADLSALHKYRDEVREPLVKVMERIVVTDATEMTRGEIIWLLKDALVKVKERK